jgi:hypothetical protein
LTLHSNQASEMLLDAFLLNQKQSFLQQTSSQAPSEPARRRTNLRR